MIGPEEMHVLVERHLIYSLVDFYLGDDAPQGRIHGQQPRKKMGDKFSSPILTHMAETLSVLVRGCHSRASIAASNAYTTAAAAGSLNENPIAIIPPTSLTDQLELMPNDDLSCLYHTNLYGKALKEGIH